MALWNVIQPIDWPQRTLLVAGLLFLLSFQVQVARSWGRRAGNKAAFGVAVFTMRVYYKQQVRSLWWPLPHLYGHLLRITDLLLSPSFQLTRLFNSYFFKSATRPHWPASPLALGLTINRFHGLQVVPLRNHSLISFHGDWSQCNIRDLSLIFYFYFVKDKFSNH